MDEKLNGTLHNKYGILSARVVGQFLGFTLKLGQVECVAGPKEQLENTYSNIIHVWFK